MNILIDTWIENIKKYPPSELFNGKYGKEAKAEERIKIICEDLYFFSSETKINHLSNLYVSYRELQVLYNFGFNRIKPEYLKLIIDNFIKYSQIAIKELDNMFKKDQILISYYNNWKLKFIDIKNELYKLNNMV